MSDTLSPKQEAKEQRAADRQKKREAKPRAAQQIKRVAKVASSAVGIGAKMATARAVSRNPDMEKSAKELTQTLGELKGPLMKIAQFLTTVPDFLPIEFAEQLAQLQANAPAMDQAFVTRRMRTELGPDWQKHFASFDLDAAAAASLGQVHKGRLHDGTDVAVKLQYVDMSSAVEADLKQMAVLFKFGQAVDSSVDISQMKLEITDRLREELNYQLEAKHMELYFHMLANEPRVRVPQPVGPAPTPRSLSMEWLEGRPLLEFIDAPLADRNEIARAMFAAWWGPLARCGVIHGDPHLGNYTVRDDMGINLLDFGCIRIFTPEFVQGTVIIYRGLQANDQDMLRAGYARWGFDNLDGPMVEIMTYWAKFVLGPMLDDKVRTIADGVAAEDFGRAEAAYVRAQLRGTQSLTIPREFVFMERAMIGLGAVFHRLGAEMNWHRMFNEAIDGFDLETMRTIQQDGLDLVGLDPPH